MHSLWAQCSWDLVETVICDSSNKGPWLVSAFRKLRPFIGKVHQDQGFKSTETEYWPKFVFLIHPLNVVGWHSL